MLTSLKDGNVFRIFERRLLRMMIGLTDVSDTWRTNNELYTPCGELDIAKVIKIGIGEGGGRWL
jgi:hypothetical protein